MYCTKCGTKLPDHSRFCPKCGKPVPSVPGGKIPSSKPSAEQHPDTKPDISVPIPEKQVPQPPVRKIPPRAEIVVPAPEAPGKSVPAKKPPEAPASAFPVGHTSDVAQVPVPSAEKKHRFHITRLSHRTERTQLPPQPPASKWVWLLIVPLAAATGGVSGLAFWLLGGREWLMTILMLP